MLCNFLLSDWSGRDLLGARSKLKQQRITRPRGPLVDKVDHRILSAVTLDLHHLAITLPTAARIGLVWFNFKRFHGRFPQFKRSKRNLQLPQ